MSRLVQYSKLSLCRFSITTSRNGRLFSTGTNDFTAASGSAHTDKVKEAEKLHVPPPPSDRLSATGTNDFTAANRSAQTDKVEEAETLHVPPPPTEKLLVLGGNGFVGTHVCKEAVSRGITVASLNRNMPRYTLAKYIDSVTGVLEHGSLFFGIAKSWRSGRPAIPESWPNNVMWHQGNLFFPDTWKDALKGVTSVISCVGGFGSNAEMYKVNGTANINAIKAASEAGVKRFVYISAADYGLVNHLLQGYFEGKRAAETELLTRFPYGGIILRPGFVHGTRRVGNMKLPLSVIGSPLEMVLKNAKSLSQIPLVGPLFIPPVSVDAVAKVAVRAATDPVFPPGILDVYGIIRHTR